MFRECPEHGWMATSEYTTDESGETICPICRTAVVGFKYDAPNGVLAKAQNNPREKFAGAVEEYHDEIGR